MTITAITTRHEALVEEFLNTARRAVCNDPLALMLCYFRGRNRALKLEHDNGWMSDEVLKRTRLDLLEALDEAVTRFEEERESRRLAA